MRYFFFSIFFLSLVSLALAQSDTFVVNTLIGDDDEPPTTPLNVLSTPISSDQIDITWDASTDNFLLSGYQVFRDALQIATTTLTTYSDTGLSPETLYTYTITAFDSAGNFSSSSVAGATTTLAITPTSTPTTTSSGTSGSVSQDPIEILDLIIDTDTESADISFDTNVYTKATLRWGRTINYELGYVSSDVYRKSHQTFLDNLLPGTLYELEIILIRNLTGETVYRRLQFYTKSLPDSTPPPNVSNLQAVLNNSLEVSLTWDNPTVADLSHVRVLSSDRFYPSDSFDGWFVYEGDEDTVLDNRTFDSDIRYYSVFVFDDNGNRSSGAVTYVRAVRGEVIEDVEFPVETTDSYAAFDFSDLSIWQNGESGINDGNVIMIYNNEESTFHIPYPALPEHLKTVVLTLVDKDTGAEFSFLLSINAGKTAYEAIVAPLNKLGEYTAVIQIFDYNAAVVKKIIGEVIVVDRVSTTPIEYIKTVFKVNWPLIGATATLWFLLLIYIWRRTQLREDNVVS